MSLSVWFYSQVFCLLWNTLKIFFHLSLAHSAHTWVPSHLGKHQKSILFVTDQYIGHCVGDLCWCTLHTHVSVCTSSHSCLRISLLQQNKISDYCLGCLPGGEYTFRLIFVTSNAFALIWLWGVAGPSGLIAQLRCSQSPSMIHCFSH